MDYPHMSFARFNREVPEKELRPVFENYGAWKNIAIKKHEDEIVVLAENMCTLRFNNIQQNPSAILPVGDESFNILHPFLFLTKPCCVKQILTDPKLIDLYSKEKLMKGRGCTFVGNYIRRKNSLALFHPDVTHKTFLDLFANKYESKLKKDMASISELDLLFSNMTSSRDSRWDCGVQNFSTVSRGNIFFNASLLDVSQEVLDPIMIEDNDVLSNNCIGNRDYSSGLSYHKIKEDVNFNQLGILVSPVNNDVIVELRIQLLSFKNAFKDGNCYPKITLGSEIKFEFYSPVLQIGTMEYKSNKDEIFIGIRTSFSVIIILLNTSNIQWKPNNNKAKFLENDCLNVLNVIKLKHTTSYFCFNPLLKNECLITTSIGQIFLCKCTGSHNSKELELVHDAEVASPKVKWLSALYTDNPRLIYIADSQTVSLLNLRSRQKIEIFNVKKTNHQNDVIWGIQKTNNAQELLISTNFKIFLMDYRHIEIPLLEWSVNTKFPCLYMTYLHMKTSATENATYHTNAIFAASQTCQETQCFLYCNTILKDRCPPQSMGSPISIDTFCDTFNEMDPNTMPEYSYLKNRLNSPLYGIAAVKIGNSFSDTQKVILLILNSLGDIGYQSLNYEKEQSSENITPNPQVNRESNIKQDNYKRWCEAAVAGMEVPTKPKTSAGIDCKITEHMIGTLTRGLDGGEDRKHPRCSWCNDVPPPNEQDIDERDMHEICGLCGFDVYTTSKLTNTMFSKNISSQKVWVDPKPRSDIPDLHFNDFNDINKGSSCARLLKATWSDTYENYWQYMSNKEMEDQEKAREQSLDILSQSQ